MNEHKICFIGIDIGTTNIKCVTVDPEGNCLNLKHTPSAPMRSNGEFVPQLLWEGICKILLEAVEDLTGIAIRGIAVSSIGCAQFCLDTQDQWIRLPKGAQLEAGDTLCRQWFQELGEEAFYRQFHYPPESGYFPFCFYALKHTDPDAFQRVSKVLSVSDYINYRLCGTWIRDPSLTGSFSMLDRNTNTWSGLVMDALGVDGKIFGQLGTGGEQIGCVTETAHRECALPVGTPVCTGGHDYLCAALGCNWTAEQGIFNVLGTFEMVTRISCDEYVNGWDGIHRVFSDLHVIPGYHTLTMEHLSGPHLNWFVNTCLHPTGLSFQDLNVQPDVPGTLFYDPDRGVGEEGFFDCIDNRTPEELYQALLEGLCYRSRKAFDHIRTVTGSECNRVCSVGGGSSSPFWMQIKADILGMTICVPQRQEASGIGAAILASVGSGYYSTFREALEHMSPKNWTIYVPDTHRSQLYQISYAAWQEGGNKQ